MLTPAPPSAMEVCQEADALNEQLELLHHRPAAEARQAGARVPDLLGRISIDPVHARDDIGEGRPVLRLAAQAVGQQLADDGEVRVEGDEVVGVLPRDVRRRVADEQIEQQGPEGVDIGLLRQRVDLRGRDTSEANIECTIVGEDTTLG